jgi:hypothetical protein
MKETAAVFAPPMQATKANNASRTHGKHDPGPHKDAVSRPRRATSNQAIMQLLSHPASHLEQEVLRSPGQALDAATRGYFEPRFRQDLSAVRLHTDRRAAESVRAVGASAYTVGAHIVLGPGRYNPVTEETRRLLAHELAHVVQNRGQGTGAAMQPLVGAPGDAPEREAEAAADALMSGRHSPSLAPALPALRRRCSDELGSPLPDCKPSDEGVAGWQFLFKVGCDDLLPGDEGKIDKLRPGSQLNIHGFASSDGPAGFNDALSCHRANRIAELARARRADCPVIGTFKHGESPAAAPGVIPDVNRPQFWRSVIVEEIKPTPESGELWLDPAGSIRQGWALYERAKHDPSPANLDLVVAHRAQLRTWLEDIPKSLAPPGAELNRRQLTDYRRFYDSAERLWRSIDQLLAVQRHAAAATDTYTAWAAGSGSDSGSEFHAKHVPPGAKYHIDIFGEGYFPGAVNIGMAMRTSTTGVPHTRVPNLIYRKFSGKTANHLPIADHTADLVTSENGPLQLPGILEEIERITAPGGTIVLYGPRNMERYHDKLARLVGGVITKFKGDDTIESRIVVPGP